eukprot:scaffold116432_cov63-Phaeocystis_antarctica.AAC.8
MRALGERERERETPIEEGRGAFLNLCREAPFVSHTVFVMFILTSPTVTHMTPSFSKRVTGTGNEESRAADVCSVCRVCRGRPAPRRAPAGALAPTVSSNETGQVVLASKDVFWAKGTLVALIFNQKTTITNCTRDPCWVAPAHLHGTAAATSRSHGRGAQERCRRGARYTSTVQLSVAGLARSGRRAECSMIICLSGSRSRPSGAHHASEGRTVSA